MKRFLSLAIVLLFCCCNDDNNAANGDNEISIITRSDLVDTYWEESSIRTYKFENGMEVASDLIDFKTGEGVADYPGLGAPCIWYFSGTSGITQYMAAGCEPNSQDIKQSTGYTLDIADRVLTVDKTEYNIVSLTQALLAISQQTRIDDTSYILSVYTYDLYTPHRKRLTS